MLRSEWVVQIFANDTDGDACIGTGYAIGNNLVLTARHVVYASNRAEKPNLKLVWPEHNKYEVLFADKDIIFDDKNNDIAIICCPEETPFSPPVQTLLVSEPKATNKWSTRGYFRAAKEDDERTDKGLAGTIQGVKSSVLELSPEPNIVAKNGWAGLSGAPIFIGDKLAGVISHHYKTLDKYLLGVPIPAMLTDKTFCKAIKYSVTKKIPKENGQFNQLLIQRISKALSHPNAEPLRQGLIEELDIDIEEDKRKQLTEVARQLLMLETDEAIRDYLTYVTTDCIHENGYRYEESRALIPKIKEIAEEILGWLVLSSIDEKEVIRLVPDGLDSDSLYFVLGHSTLTGVELAMSRRFQRKANWLGKETSKQSGQTHLLVQPCNFPEDDDEVVRTLLIDLWNRVFTSPIEAKESTDSNIKLTSKEIKLLNKTLRSLRKKKRNTEHYYFAFEMEEVESERVKNIFKKLLAKNMLNEMTVVEMGSSNGSKVLLLDENIVISEINGFYRELNRNLNRNTENQEASKQQETV